MHLKGAFVIIQKLVYYNPIVIGQLLITQIYYPICCSYSFMQSTRACTPSRVIAL